MEMNSLLGSSFITVIHTNYNKQLDMLDSKAEGNMKSISMFYTCYQITLISNMPLIHGTMLVIIYFNLFNF